MCLSSFFIYFVLAFISHFSDNFFFLKFQVRLLYVNFAMIHYPATDEASNLMYVRLAFVNPAYTHPTTPRPTLSYQRLQTAQPLTDEELYEKIRRSVSNKHELQVLESFLIFNK